MIVFEQSGCIRGEVVVFGQKWLYSSKCGCIRARRMYLGKSGCVRAKWLYSGNVVVFGQK